MYVLQDVPEEVAIDQSSMEPANYESGFVEVKFLQTFFQILLIISGLAVTSHRMYVPWLTEKPLYLTFIFLQPIGEEDSGMDEAGRLMEAFGETLDGTTDDAAEDVMEDSANVNPTVITSPGPNKVSTYRVCSLLGSFLVPCQAPPPRLPPLGEGEIPFPANG